MFTFDHRDTDQLDTRDALAPTPFMAPVHAEHVFESRSYAAAVEHMAAQMRAAEPFSAITGGPGSGKTTLCRTLAEFRHERALVACVSAAADFALLTQC